METQVDEAGPFERMLTVRLEPSELEDAKNAAARKLSRELKIKGFRPGKAPRAVVERMVGADAVRNEAIEDSLGGFVSSALGETDLAPVTTPRVEEIKDADDGGLEVAVRITLWPTVDEIPSLVGRTVEIDVPTVEEEEIEEQIDRLRNQFAELDDVTREADDGDFVLINLSARGASGDIDAAAANDLLYEVGSQSFVPGLDPLLVGASAGDIREGPGTLPAGFGGDEPQDVTLKVLVKGVRAKRLPEVTDEWVSDVTEFDTVAELSRQLERNLLAMKKSAAGGVFRDQLMLQLTEELDLDLPEPLVEAEMEASLHNLYHGLESQGIDLQTYLRITGQDQEAFVAELRARATRALKTRILLESVAAAEGLEVDESEMDAAVARLAAEADQDPGEVRSALDASGQGTALSGDILRRKALDRVLEEATPVDAAGNPVDLDIVDEDEDHPMDDQDTERDHATDEDSAPDADNQTQADDLG
jgi:trigger factor